MLQTFQACCKLNVFLGEEDGSCLNWSGAHSSLQENALPSDSLVLLLLLLAVVFHSQAV